MRQLLLLLTTLLITSSCSNKIKHAVGIVTPGPDEYKVQKNKSLDVPPHYELVAPNTNSSEN